MRIWLLSCLLCGLCAMPLSAQDRREPPAPRPNEVEEAREAVRDAPREMRREVRETPRVIRTTEEVRKTQAERTSSRESKSYDVLVMELATGPDLDPTVSSERLLDLVKRGELKTVQSVRCRVVTDEICNVRVKKPFRQRGEGTGGLGGLPSAETKLGVVPSMRIDGNVMLEFRYESSGITSESPEPVAGIEEVEIYTNLILTPGRPIVVASATGGLPFILWVQVDEVK